MKIKMRAHDQEMIVRRGRKYSAETMLLIEGMDVSKATGKTIEITGLTDTELRTFPARIRKVAKSRGDRVQISVDRDTRTITYAIIPPNGNEQK